jgi:hypothetical protein
MPFLARTEMIYCGAVEILDRRVVVSPSPTVVRTEGGTAKTTRPENITAE